MSAADVLAVLTDDAREQVVRSFATTFRRDVTLDAQGWRAGPLSGRWSVTPAEGVEVLATRGLWPWPVGDDAAPRWWCEQCGGSGLDPRVGLYRKPCTERCDWGTAADPPTLAALVAVASLGAPTLRTAEELARVLVGREPRIVWRVMSRGALDAHVDAMSMQRPEDVSEWTLPGAFARETAIARMGNAAWMGVCPFDDARVERAWPVLRNLAALGLHLVALDGDRVTLAVEAL